MLKFIRGKGSHPSAERLQIQKELFQFQKTVQHGFPSKPSALAWDSHLRLLSIATKTGIVKVFGQPGVEFYGQHEKEVNVSRLLFIPGKGRIISLCDDNSLHLWDTVTGNRPSLKCIKSQFMEGKLKKISTCSLEGGGEHLLIGTENGNIYVMDLSSFEVTDSVIYLDVVMQNVTEDFKVNPGAVEVVIEDPNNSDRILIGYTRGLLVLWNRKTLSADQTFVASQQLESACWHSSGRQFITCHNDGSYIIWTVNQHGETADSDNPSKCEPAANSPYGPFPCKAMTKILWGPTSEKSSDIIAFSGGMPRANYGDRYTVSVLSGESCHVTFDLTSKVVDFCMVDVVETKMCEALIILAEEELVAIDLATPGWPTFSLPYLASLHCSAVTAQAAVTVTAQLYNRLTNMQSFETKLRISNRPWPINGGISAAVCADSSTKVLLLTGHEDGSVRFWDASTAALRQIATFSTSNCFVGEDLDAPTEEGDIQSEDEDWPPFRKVGVFDPYSDDPRLAVKKLCFCPTTGTLAVAGTAGQVVVACLSEMSIEKEISSRLVNVVSDRDNFVWKGHDKLTVRSGLHLWKAGFQPSSVLQLYPPAAITSLALYSDWSLVAVGTAHGLALYDVIQQKGVIAKCTLNPNDVSSPGDQPMSRRKSFKKSLRESFRRLRKGRSQRNASPSKPTTSSLAQNQEKGQVAACGTSTASEARPVERQIEARSNDDSMGSMVRCLLMAKTYLVSQSSTTPTLWAGTNSGSIFVFSLTLPLEDKRNSDAVVAQLAKEIQLKHKAPVISIDIIDSACASLADISQCSNKLVLAEPSGPHRVVISSEEQFKVFTLPNLRPYGKYKLTAYTGCQVRRVSIIPFTSRSDSTYVENCLVCLSNQGDFHILSLPDLRRQMNAQAIRREDIHGISTVVLTQQGEAFYLQSSSELQRVALSARNFLHLECQLLTTHVLKNEKEVTSCATGDTNVAKSCINAENNIVKKSPVISDSREEKKANSVSESNNSTIISVEPETSFGDITVDSVKDHLVCPIDENREVEVKSDRRNQESYTVVVSTTMVTSAETAHSATQE
nr:EOG090X00I4 [Cyclestheria hislopi]